MWNKLSNAFSKSSAARSSIDEENDNSRVGVMSSIYEQHPNLSNFHSSEVSFPSPSSPSKSRKSIFKRSRHNGSDTEIDRPSPPFKLTSLPKKMKSTLHINTSTSELSIRASQDSAIRPSLDRTPSTPFSDHPGRYGSLRSILRDRNTPATGQSVRFFSRDAYKTISPDNSTPSTEQEEQSFFSRLHIKGKNTAPARTTSVRPSARDVFASHVDVQECHVPDSSPSPTDASKSHALNSLMMPIPPPDLSNIFDMSQEQEIPTIAPNTQSAILDNAVELNDDILAVASLASESSLKGSLMPHDEHPSTSTPYRSGQETIFFSPNEDDADMPNSDRSKSFTFGHPVFHLPPARSSSPAPSVISDKRSSKSSVRVSDSPSISKSTKSRSRALSDTVFQSMIRSASTSSKDTLPEVEINDISNAVLVYSSSSPEPDPFRANATTYYTPGTMMPPTPPQPSHTRKASREEDMIWSLRTQLALQQDLCAQYEIDLHARDELVNALNEKLDSADKDKQHRNGVLRGWKKKVQELEKMCRGLEEEVDRSRQESFERSVMDEASSEALRELHRVIGRLEREKADIERRETEEKERRDAEVHKLEEELRRREESERQLRESIKEAKEQVIGGQDEPDAEVVKAAREEERQRHRLAEFAWAEERAELTTRINGLEKKNMELSAAAQDAEKNDGEFDVLKGELEAQWKHTESMTERISELENERDELKMDNERVEKCISDMEVDWNQSENKKIELEAELHQIVSEKSELEEQLDAERVHADALTQALQEREETVHELENERQYALGNVARLEENLRRRDTEIADLSQRIMERESDTEGLREALNRAQKERGRDVDEQVRALEEVTFREGEARKRMESLVTQKAECDVLVKTLRERVAALQEELERLRRQVHDLQQESADKEVRLTQFGKWRDQDKEDIKGLNIALDSKQQELELLKRKMGVRGTAGSTPAPVKKRESSMFGTPTIIRPPSALSDSKEGTNNKKVLDTPSSVASKTLAKSVRMNGTGPPSASSTKPVRHVEGAMGPPPTARSARPSVPGTPSRHTSIHGRTSSASLGQSATKPIVSQRRASSGLDSSVSRTKPSAVAAAARVSTPVLNERDEKENSRPSMTPTPKPVPKRTGMVAA